MSITVQQLLKILPNASQVAGVFVPVLNTAMSRYQIVGAKRMAAFIAQIGHESGQFKNVPGESSCIAPSGLRNAKTDTPDAATNGTPDARHFNQQPDWLAPNRQTAQLSKIHAPSGHLFRFAGRTA